MNNIAEGLVYYVAFLFSTTLHEAAHAWAAKKGGDLTAYKGGQVSLDPTPHVRREPIGMVVLPLISVFISGWPFGYASAPYDPEWARRYPQRAGWMALAGPAANLLLVVLSAVLVEVGLLLGFFSPPDSITFGHVIGTAQPGGWLDSIAFGIGAFFSMNLLLFVLNMLPLPPLDGSAGLLVVMPDNLIERYQQFLWGSRGLGLIGILIAWQVFGVVFTPIFFSAVGLLYPGVSYH